MAASRPPEQSAKGATQQEAVQKAADAPPSNTPAANPQGSPVAGGPKTSSGPQVTPQDKKPPAGPEGSNGGKKGKEPQGPPPLPIGVSEQLSNAYNFLAAYVQERFPLEGMGEMVPGEIMGSPLDQVGNTLPKTITQDIKNFPRYSLAAGSTPSPGLPTGQMPPQLVAGIPRREVIANQLRLPSG